MVNSKIIFLDSFHSTCRITGEYCDESVDCRRCTIPVVLCDVARDELIRLGCYKEPKRSLDDDYYRFRPAGLSKNLLGISLFFYRILKLQLLHLLQNDVNIIRNHL